MPHQDTVLILQGGGALGAYQAGVYQNLLEHHTSVDWVIGTSIGAINSALIAGNPPELRLAKLQGFWKSLEPTRGATLAAFWQGLQPWMPLSQFAGTFDALLNGVDGFFKPRVNASWNMHGKVPLEQTGFYDTSPLKATLEQFVDFDYLNSGAMRISVCAVDIDTGQHAVFDSSKQEIRPEHIMASGALPPGFPPVEIDGRAYWDGGIYSNSPLEVVLEEEEKRDALCFVVDLWDPSEARPESITEAMTRCKSIQYESRSAEQLHAHQRIQDLQRVIRVLAKNLPPEAHKSKELRPLIQMGCDHTINVVRLIMKALPDDGYFKDIDFSAATVDARWQAGLHDCKRALRHKAWLLPQPPHAGLLIHDLPKE